MRISRVLASLALTLCAGVTVAADCTPEILDIRGDWGQAQFSIEIADDGAERAQGLMHREQMDRGAGMLFVYPNPQNVSFWMKNTLIPLDMIFADSTGRVRAIHENAIPLDTTPIPGGADIQYVFEINAGLASLYGIAVGSVLRHPAIEQKNAEWTCSGN